MVDHSFEKIEGTGTYQNGSFTALLAFSDASIVDVSGDSDLQIDTLAPGTQTADAGVVTLTKDPNDVVAVAPGTVDIRFSHSGYMME